MKLGTLLGAFACMALSMGLATPAKAEDPIKIGVYMPLTGQNAFAGQLELEGIQLAHKIAPTVLGRPVELVIVDNKSDKVEAANAVKRLAERDNVTRHHRDLRLPPLASPAAKSPNAPRCPSLPLPAPTRS